MRSSADDAACGLAWPRWFLRITGRVHLPWGSFLKEVPRAQRQFVGRVVG